MDIQIKRLNTDQLALATYRLMTREGVISAITERHPGFELDYYLPSEFENQLRAEDGPLIRDNGFNITGFLDYGCEGIYMDTYLDGDIGYPGENTKYHLATAKTLGTGLNDMCAMGELLGACIHYGTLLVNSFFQRVSSEKWLENFFDTVRGENSEYRPILIRSEENTLFKETGYIMAYAKSDEYDPLEIIKNKPAYQFAQLSTVPKSEVDINIPIIDVLREY